MGKVYVTQDGDTWDKIAYEQYGSEKYMKQPISANWGKLDTLVFSYGEEIILPDIDESTEDMPIWRSADDEDDGTPAAEEGDEDE